MEGQDLTRGDIRAQLWSLAWPMMLSVFFYTLYNIVDAFWVSKLSAEAIAAISISQIILFLMAALMYITALGFQESGTIAFSLGFRVEFFAFLPAVGFGFGAMAMMGQNIGGVKLSGPKKLSIKL